MGRESFRKIINIPFWPITTTDLPFACSDMLRCFVTVLVFRSAKDALSRSERRNICPFVVLPAAAMVLCNLQSGAVNGYVVFFRTHAVRAQGPSLPAFHAKAGFEPRQETVLSAHCRGRSGELGPLPNRVIGSQEPEGKGPKANVQAGEARSTTSCPPGSRSSPVDPVRRRRDGCRRG